MHLYHPLGLAEDAGSTRANTPRTAIVHDCDAVRIIVFRIEPGQQVATHTSPSTVILTVLQGDGLVLCADEPALVHTGDVVAFAPRELHGMCALHERFVVMATITPRPGSAA